MKGKDDTNGTSKVGDFYWAYADIIRGQGVPPATYDQRILAFMALKLLVDNDKLQFNFDYKHQFGLGDAAFAKYKKGDTKAIFTALIQDLEHLGSDNLRFFEQEKKYNPGESTHVLAYFNHPKVFPFQSYIDELSNEHLEMVLDIYIEKADFRGYPKEGYKDLYERTIARMKKLSGDLTGQHFTQKPIIHLMCEMALKQIKKNEDKIAIYDPACGTGSMLMEAAHYFHEKLTGKPKIEVYGQEISGQIWFLSKIFLEISTLDGEKQGIENIIAYDNTLTEPAFADGINGDDSFDFIIANPPFGVDWKHMYDEVVSNMKSGFASHYFVVQDEKGKIVTPKKSDGQFLFMQHIIHLMQKEKDRKKRAVAGIISSSTLASTGSDTSSEAKIRRQIFGQGVVKAIVEQPNGMFTNTDIASHIWFLDTEASEKIKILKTDNEEQPLYAPHVAPQDKMKSSYSYANIKKIVNYLHQKKEHTYISKNIDPVDCHGISISTEIGKKDTLIDVSLDDLENRIKQLIKELGENSFIL